LKHASWEQSKKKQKQKRETVQQERIHVAQRGRHTMSSRFGRQDARDDLFSSYNRSASPSKSKNKARASPYNGSIGGGYGYTAPVSPSGGGGGSPGFGAYPGAGGLSNGNLYPGSSSRGGYGIGGGGSGSGGEDGMFRSATPNSRGQYSSAVLDELESQNEEHVGVLTGKVKMLKDVCLFLFFFVIPPFLIFFLSFSFSFSFSSSLLTQTK
jgi:hypothetical protein